MIKISSTPCCDTRALKGEITEKNVIRDSKKHIKDVNKIGKMLCKKFNKQLKHHDYTKINYNRHSYIRALKSGLTDKKFKELNWYKIHTKQERHHLRDNCPKDVNLLDVLEMIIDEVSSSVARENSKLASNYIPEEILKRAVKNTYKLILNNVCIKEKFKKISN